MKKAMTWLVSAALGVSSIMPFGAAAAGGGRFTLTDLARAAQYLAGKTELTPEETAQFDVNGEGGVTLTDLVIMAQDYAQADLSKPPAAETTPTPSAAVTVVPAPSPASFSLEDAVVFALEQVDGAGLSDVLSQKVDFEDGQEMYEIEISYGGAEYDFSILTTSPTIYKESMEKRPTPGYAGSEQTEQSAKNIVLSKIRGASEADFTRFRLDTEDGVAVYEGALKSNGYEYEFEIVRSTGEIIQWSRKMTVEPVPMPTMPPMSTNPGVPTSEPTWVPVPEAFSLEEAAAFAVSRVEGASLSNVTSAKLDYEDGQQMYEIEITYDGADYDFSILTTSPDIYKESMERWPTPGYQGSQQTEQSAKNLVLSRIPGASETDFTEFFSDTDDDVLVYEGKLRSDGYEYEFEIVQSTGEIIQWSRKMIVEPVPTPTAATASPTPAATPTIAVAVPTAGQQLTAEQAQQIAVARIPGASLENVTSCRPDTEDGVQIFDIEVRCDGAKYEYEIAAANGRILQESMERRPTAGYQGTQQTEQSARELAVSMVPGASLSDITNFEADHDDGTAVFEIELRYDEAEWDFVIVRATGEIISQSMDVYAAGAQPAQPSPTSVPVQPAPALTQAPAQDGISRDEAISIALGRVPGASASDVTKCELDYDNGVREYEIEIFCKGVEYSITINASSGVVTDFDADYDD